MTKLVFGNIPANMLESELFGYAPYFPSDQRLLAEDFPGFKIPGVPQAQSIYPAQPWVRAIAAPEVIGFSIVPFYCFDDPRGRIDDLLILLKHEIRLAEIPASRHQHVHVAPFQGLRKIGFTMPQVFR